MRPGSRIGSRVRWIRANPLRQPQVITEAQVGAEHELAWVMVRGSAVILDGGDEYDVALAALRERYPQYRAMALEGRPLIRLVPERVSSWGLRP